MRFSFKILCLVLLISLNFTCVTVANAACSDTPPDDPNQSDFVDFISDSTGVDDLVDCIAAGEFDINTLTNGMPIYSGALPGSAGALACDFLRQIKCGGIPVIIVTVAIFTLGMLTLMQKMKPMYAILIASFIALFLYADQLVRLIMDDFLGSGGWLGWLATGCVCTNFTW